MGRKRSRTHVFLCRRPTVILPTCDTRLVKLILNPRACLGVFVVLAASIVASCFNGDDPSDDIPQPVDGAQSSMIAEDIPTEALPDPLPAPYLFRDDVVIEEAPITETIYVVRPGDTLATIASQFCLTVEEVQRLNNIVDVNELSIGQELRIPVREGACGVAAPVSETPAVELAEPERPPGEIYIIQEGDTLADIASQFGYTWVDLMTYNGLSEAQATSLQIGQALIIPPQPESDSDSQSDEVEDVEEEEEPGPSEPPG